MKIVIAPDSFKGNLSSLQVATAIEKGILRVLPRARCLKVPMADGGEGTVRSMLDALGGKLRSKVVVGPAGESVRARYALLADGKTAVIEMAEASGLHLIPKPQRQIHKATSHGTGLLIKDAISRNLEKIKTRAFYLKMH